MNVSPDALRGALPVQGGGKFGPRRVQVTECAGFVKERLRLAPASRSFHGKAGRSCSPRDKLRRLFRRRAPERSVATWSRPSALSELREALHQVVRASGYIASPLSPMLGPDLPIDARVQLQGISHRDSSRLATQAAREERRAKYGER